ncbi:hypothetical protein EDD85DRAFT_797357 [Armillaria nabsnona]|nr:hypothetical protein EDD85DRAFT_797357 [Armillaria nabsnona]
MFSASSLRIPINFEPATFIAVADLSTVAERTALVGGASYLEALVIVPAMHRQQLADERRTSGSSTWKGKMENGQTDLLMVFEMSDALLARPLWIVQLQDTVLADVRLYRAGGKGIEDVRLTRHDNYEGCFALAIETGVETSTMSTGARPFRCVAVTFLRNYFLIGFIEAGMTLLAVQSTSPPDVLRSSTEVLGQALVQGIGVVLEAGDHVGKPNNKVY